MSTTSRESSALRRTHDTGSEERDSNAERSSKTQTQNENRVEEGQTIEIVGATTSKTVTCKSYWYDHVVSDAPQRDHWASRDSTAESRRDHPNSDLLIEHMDGSIERIFMGFVMIE